MDRFFVCYARCDNVDAQCGFHRNRQRDAPLARFGFGKTLSRTVKGFRYEYGKVAVCGEAVQDPRHEDSPKSIRHGSRRSVSQVERLLGVIVV